MAKPRAVQGDLRKLMYYPREQLHSWFREKGGTITYEELRRRLKDKFGLNVSTTSLSNYYNEHNRDIVGGNATAENQRAKTIVIRIEVPAAGFRIDVATETEGAAESQ